MNSNAAKKAYTVAITLYIELDLKVQAVIILHFNNPHIAHYLGLQQQQQRPLRYDRENKNTT